MTYNNKLLTVFSVFTVLVTVCFPNVYAQEKQGFADGGQLYKWYCSACHGTKGDGKGFNAKNLDPRPADHTDIKLMNKRTDKELYDAISGGGRLAGKSTLMPPWGNSLNETQIKSLVLYLRELCDCTGI